MHSWTPHVVFLNATSIYRPMRTNVNAMNAKARSKAWSHSDNVPVPPIPVSAPKVSVRQSVFPPVCPCLCPTGVVTLSLLTTVSKIASFFWQDEAELALHRRLRTGRASSAFHSGSTTPSPPLPSPPAPQSVCVGGVHRLWVCYPNSRTPPPHAENPLHPPHSNLFNFAGSEEEGVGCTVGGRATTHEKSQRHAGAQLRLCPIR